MNWSGKRKAFLIWTRTVYSIDFCRAFVIMVIMNVYKHSNVKVVHCGSSFKVSLFYLHVPCFEQPVAIYVDSWS